MKQLLLATICLLMSAVTFAQGTSFATADTMSMGVTKTGNITSAVPDHYYKIILPANGILRMVRNVTNTGSNTLVIQRLYVYNRNHTQIEYKDINPNTPSVAVVDTFVSSAYSIDTFYLRMENIWGGQPLSYSIKCYLGNTYQNNETEPNNTWGTAQNISRNQQIYGSTATIQNGAGYDVDDYFKIKMPAEGALKLIIQSTSLYHGSYSSTIPGALVQIYSKSFTQYSIKNKTGNVTGNTNVAGSNSVAFNATVFDTMYVYAKSDDSMYIRISNYHTGLGMGWTSSYKLKWDTAYAVHTNEVEPNDLPAQAQQVAENQVITGTTNYVANGGTDAEDIYRIVLNKFSNFRLYIKARNDDGYNTTQASLYVRMVNKNYANFSGSYFNINNAYGTYAGSVTLQNGTPKIFGQYTYDTITHYAMAPDTFYLAISSFFNAQYGGRPASYQFYYKLIDTAQNTTSEPITNFAQAQSLAPNQTLHGHVGYHYADFSGDNENYFKIAKPANATVKVYITAKFTENSYGSNHIAPVVYAYNKAQNAVIVYGTVSASSAGVVLKGFWGNCNYGKIITDTMTITCQPDDSLYIHVYSHPGSASFYSIRYEVVPRPDAAFIYSNVGNEYGFINQSTHAVSYVWNINGANVSSNQFLPLQSFVPNHYVVKLLASDGACVPDTFSRQFDVKGFEYYTPNHAGQGGDVAVQVFGGGLDTSCSFILKQGGTMIYPREKYVNGKHNHLTCIMDLHNAAAGNYDVIIKVTGLPDSTITNGFTVENFKYPYAWSQIVGPSRFLRNRDTRFKLVVGNNGNVMASGVVVAMVWPQSLNVTFLSKEESHRTTGSDSVMGNNNHLYVIPRSKFAVYYDSLDCIAPIDSFEGKPYQGYIRYLLIRHVPSNGTIELPFIANSSVSSMKQMYTFVSRPNILGSCPTGSWEDFANAWTTEMLNLGDDMVDKTKIPLLQAFVKTAKVGQNHMRDLSTYAGTEFWAWWDGYETDHEANMIDYLKATDVSNEALKQALVQEFTSAVLKGATLRAGELNKDIKALESSLANSGNLTTNNFKDISQKLLSASQGQLSRLERMKIILNATKNLGDLSAKQKELLDIINNCPDLLKQHPELLNSLDDELNHSGLNGTGSNTVNSLDPNQISGASGVGVNQYINNYRRQPFVVEFENADTAAASAQVVTVNDTIDVSKFAMRSFMFGDIRVANQSFRVPTGRYEFMLEKSLDSIRGLFIRISAHADTTTGIVQWTFVSIDSITHALPILDGFLPPNVHHPNGTASVSYSVEPKSNLTDGTISTSKASIVFDDNTPMRTNIWSNTLDVLPPTSQVQSITLKNDSIAQLKMTGTDNTSGIFQYKIFYQTNGGTWNYLGTTNVDTLDFKGAADSSYAFYSLAVDWVENREIKSPINEASIIMPATGVSELTSDKSYINIYPNPAQHTAILSFSSIESQSVKVNLINNVGQTVAKLYEGKIDSSKTILLDVSKIHTGIYLVELTGDKGFNSRKKIVVVN